MLIKKYDMQILGMIGIEIFVILLKQQDMVFLWILSYNIQEKIHLAYTRHHCISLAKDWVKCHRMHPSQISFGGIQLLGFLGNKLLLMLIL